MILTQLRDKIVAGIKTAAPSLKEVKEHGGRFGLAEIKAAATKAPAARVACLGLSGIEFEGAVAKARSVWGVFIVAADQVASRRDAVALAMVATLGAVLPGNCWTLEASVDGARDVRADNLFSRELDRQGVSLWALTFNHLVDLGRVDPADLDDFVRAYVDYDLAPTDGTVDAIDQIILPTE
jgi:phage gp37-like protein